MSRHGLPVWMREGYRRNGPGGLTCGRCGKRVSSNALARASHSRGCTGSVAARLAKEKR